jgi:hypothetical protein
LEIEMMVMRTMWLGTVVAIAGVGILSCGAIANPTGQEDASTVNPTASESAAIASPATTSAEAAPAQGDPPTLAQADAQATRGGAFVVAEPNYPTQGRVDVVERDGQTYLEFSADFATVEGPDVQVILYGDRTVPIKLADTPYTRVAMLNSFSGAQSYAVPADVMLGDYQAVAIWCREFDVTFAYVSL